MKRFALSLILVVAIAALSSAAALASVPDITGQWNTELTGPNGVTEGTVSIDQGTNIEGKNLKTGFSFIGRFCTPHVDKHCTSPLQIKANWTDLHGGAGWLNIYVAPNGRSFQGTWGYSRHKASGTFVGNEILRPRS